MRYFQHSLFIFAVFFALSVPLVSFAAGPAVTLVAGSKTLTATGQGTSLAWTVSSDATNCTSTGPWGSFMSQPFNGSAPSTGGLSLPSNIFSITCTGPGGSTTVSEEVKIFVNGNSPVISSFTAVGGAVTGISPFKSQTFTFNWVATGAIYCALSSPLQGINFTGQLPVSGSTSLNISANETYTLSCPAASGAVVPTATAQYAVVTNLNPVGPTVTFTATPATGLKVGDAVTVEWNSSNVTTCNGNGDLSFGLYGDSTANSNTKILSGSKTYILSYPGTFNLSLLCNSSNGGRTTTNLTLNVATASTTTTNTGNVDPYATNQNTLIGVKMHGPFGDGPFTMTLGDSLPLTWSVTPYTAASSFLCTASGTGDLTGWSGALPAIGSFRPAPRTSARYTITCQKSGSIVSDSVIVNVVNTGVAPRNSVPSSPVVAQATPTIPTPPSTTPASNSSTGDSGNGTTCDAPITATLTYRNRGAQVLILQNFLVDQNLLDEENTSGYFGALTRGAVQQFQAKNNIVSVGGSGYGQVGPRTREAINKICAGTTGSSTGSGNRDVVSGGNGSDISSNKIGLSATSLGNNFYKITWTSVGVSSCSSNDFYVPNDATSTAGSATVSASRPTTYSIICVKASGAEEGHITIGGTAGVGQAQP